MSQSFRINTNVGALRAYNALSKLNSQSQTSQLRLASQKRINHVSDDTSGFNVGKSLGSKVTIMQSTQRNVGSAQDMLATAEGQLISIKDMITQIRSKMADASNPTADNSAIAKDIQAVTDEIFSAFSTTKFNETNLLQSVSGGAGSGFTFQTGVSSSDSININYGNVSGNELVGTSSTTAWGEDSFNLVDYWDEDKQAYVYDSERYIMRDETGGWFIGVHSEDETYSAKQAQYSSINLKEDYPSGEGVWWNYFEPGNNPSSYSGNISGLSSTVGSALDSLKNVTSSTISNLSLGGFENAVDASLGAIGNYSQRLDAKQDFLSSAILNSKSAYSRLFDADVALESLNATKSQIGAQAATSMFAQMNAAPQQVLQLFG